MEIVLWPEGAPMAKGAGDEDRPALFPYLLDGTNRPSVIVCPGGGYGMRADHEGEPIAKWLNALGISAFVLRYRVAPYRYPCALLDVQRAIRTVRQQAEQFGINPDQVGVLGFSAGGHLVATAGTHYDSGDRDAAEAVERHSCKPDLLMLCYPVITMKDPYTHEGSRLNLLGSNPSEEQLDLLSNEQQVNAETPPTFLWHTSDDGAVPVENSLNFAAALRKHGVLFDLHVYAQGRHGLGLAEDDAHVRGWTAACATWLKFNGFQS